MRTKNILRIVLGTALILLIPLVAMRFSDERDWDLTDFIVMGALLLSSGLIYELIASRMASSRRRLLLGAMVVFAVLLIWADLAVGIFNIPGFSGS